MPVSTAALAGASQGDDTAASPQVHELVSQPITLVRKLAIGATVGLTLLYVLHLSPQWYLSNDSALYLMLGENLAEGEGYTLYGEPHAHVPPGFPMLLAGLMRLGLDNHLVFNLVVGAMGLGTLALAYRAIKPAAGAWRALVVVLVVGCCWQMFFNSGRVLSDIPFMFTAFAAIVCLQRGLQSDGKNLWLECGVLLLVATCWVRVAGFPLAIAAAPGLAFSRRHVPFWRLALCLMLLSAGVWGTYRYFRACVKAAQTKNTTVTYSRKIERLQDTVAPKTAKGAYSSAEKVARNFYTVGDSLAQLFCGPGVMDRLHHWKPTHRLLKPLAIPLLWLPIGIGAVVGLMRRQTLLVCAAGGYVGALVIMGSLLPRYYLPVAPLLVLAYLVGVERMARWLPRIGSRAGWIAAAMAALLVVVNLPNDLFALWCQYTPYKTALQPLRESHPEVAEFLRQNLPADAYFAGENSSSLAYLSGCRPLPNPKQQLRQCPDWQNRIDEMLQANRVELVVVMNEDVPGDFTSEVASAMRSGNKFKPVFQNKYFTVLGSRSFEPVAKSCDPTQR